jgi:hypothetical protein
MKEAAVIDLLTADGHMSRRNVRRPSGLQPYDPRCGVVDALGPFGPAVP